MKEIVSKLKSLIYGTQNNPIKAPKEDLIIDDSDTLNKLVKNIKRS